MNNRNYLILILLVLTLLSVVISCGLGAVYVSVPEWLSIVGNKLGISGTEGFSKQQEAVIWTIRLPRVLMSILVGGSLALCGASMQGLFRNPLADPTIIGISAGAVLAAALVIVLANGALELLPAWVGLSALSVATFAGAGTANLFILRLARENRRTNVATMLLGGIGLTALAGAFTGVMTYLADDAQLRSLTFWTLGSLGGITWQVVGFMAVAFTISFLFLSPLSKSFNAMALGEQEASHLGIPIEKVKLRVMALTALTVGCSVAFCGMIGFVGLVVPHIIRLAGGSDHRFLLPASAVGGALLLCWADTLSRTVVIPAEIPIGVITSLAGAPIFLYLLYRQKTS